MADSTYKAPALLRAARILAHVAEAARPPSLTELSQALGLGKSTVHGLLHTLEGLAWVEREAGGYRLGPGLPELLGRARTAGDLAAAARPLLEGVSQRLGESVFLGRRQGEVVVVLDCVEGVGNLRLASLPGTELPLLAAALGKVFLAGLSPEEARAALAATGLSRFTDRSITDPEAFLAEVDRVRSRGFATDDEEYLGGVRAVAAPVVRAGRTVAALWTAGFASRLDDAGVERAGKELRRAARALSELLYGGEPPAPPA